MMGNEEVRSSDRHVKRYSDDRWRLTSLYHRKMCDVMGELPTPGVTAAKGMRRVCYARFILPPVWIYPITTRCLSAEVYRERRRKFYRTLCFDIEN